MNKPLTALGILVAAFAITPAMTYAAGEPAMIGDIDKGKAWVDEKGMALYTFGKDEKGTKTAMCTGDCIAEWPPLLAPADAKANGEWTLVAVVDKDGKTKQMWAYGGKPLYLFADDKKPGQVTGDGVDDFHLAKAE
jgi:predicted lipoprotein with Yx(FWY)xxD motif